MDIARLLPNRLLNLQPAQTKVAPADDDKPSIAQSVVVALSLSRTQVESPKDEDPQGILQALRRAELESSESRKSMARAELERLKERIAHLKMMLAFMGPSAAKGLAAQIKALASQMGNLAAILKEGGGGGGAQANGAAGVTSAMAGVTQAVKGVLDRQAGADAAQLAASAAGEDTQAARVAASAQAQAAGAAASASKAAQDADDVADTSEASADDGGAGAAVDALEDAAAALTSALQDAAKAPGSDHAAQRREDAKLLREALESLKQLIALYKASRQRKTGGDGNHPDIDQAVQSLKGVESAIGSLGGATASLGGLGGF